VWWLLWVYIRAEIAKATWSAIRFLGMILLGVIVSLGSCTVVGGGGTVVVMHGNMFGTAAAGQPLPSSGAISGLGVAMIDLFKDAAAQSGCNVPWSVIQGVARTEDPSLGATHAIGAAIIQQPSGFTVHAYGPAQFLNGTWMSYGDHVDPPLTFDSARHEIPPAPDAHIWQPRYAYPALGRYLCALGFDRDPVRALWSYSGCVPGPGCSRSDTYPFTVLSLARDAEVFASLPPVSPLAARVLAEAATWAGTRYVFGGFTRNGIDCSAYVMTVYASVGVIIPRTTQLQWNATVARGMGVSTPQVGDLAFFRQTYFDPDQLITHVGIVSRVDADGSVWIWHAPGARAAGDPPDFPFGRVREEPIAGFLAQHLAGYAHVLPNPPATNQA
jgi:cell wall-associated NlpC family hydrolase